jgi:hypothetical protein
MSRQHGSLRLTVRLPSGARGTVVLPRANGSHLTVQAPHAVRVIATAGGYRIAVCAGAGGKYTFIVTA